MKWHCSSCQTVFESPVCPGCHKEVNVFSATPLMEINWVKRKPFTSSGVVTFGVPEESNNPVEVLNNTPLSGVVSLSDNEMPETQKKEFEVSSTVSIRTPEAVVESNPVVWNGEINMPDVAKFTVSAHQVSGTIDYLTVDLKQSLKIVGRISPDQVWKYISKIKESLGKEISLIELRPSTNDKQSSYETFYNYLVARKRFGVIGRSGSLMLQDGYIVPLAADEELNAALKPLDGPGLDGIRTNILLALIIRTRRKRPGDAERDEQSAIASAAKLDHMNSKALNSSDLKKAVASLKENLEALVSRCDELEKKFSASNLIVGQMESLKVSKDYLTREEIQQLQNEISKKEIQSAEVAAINARILKLQTEMNSLMGSREYNLSLTNSTPNCSLKKFNDQISESKAKLKKAMEIESALAELKSHPDYLAEDDMENISEILKAVKEVVELKSKSPKTESFQEQMTSILDVQEKVKKELECSICLELPSAQGSVFSCRSHHLLCFTCYPRTSSCPVCRQSFIFIPATRNLLAEKIIANLG